MRVFDHRTAASSLSPSAVNQAPPRVRPSDERSAAWIRSRFYRSKTSAGTRISTISLTVSPKASSNNLSQLPRLKVMARSTVFRYKGRQIDPQEIGQSLGVRAVLTGRVLQRDDSLMIGAELVDVGDGSQLWGAQFSRQLSEILTIQEEISREITEHLRIRLTPAERKRLVRGPRVSASAYQLYLKGRYYLNQRSPSAIEKARDFFEQAITADPGYALAHSGLADSHAISATLFTQAGREQAIQRARTAANRALELDEADAEAHASLAFIKYRFDWDWTGAEIEFKRALALNPGHAKRGTGSGCFSLRGDASISPSRRCCGRVRLTHCHRSS